MTAEQIGSTVDAAIPLVTGVVVALLGWRVLGKKPGASPALDQWHAKWGKAFRLLGPALGVFGALRIGLVFFGADAPTAPDPAKAEMAKKLAELVPGKELEMSPGVFMLMHRIQAVSPTPDHWHRAVSTEGRFSVDLPLPFNDFRIRSVTTDGVELRAHTIGAKSPGLLAWSAACMARRDGKLNAQGGAAGPDKFEVLGSPPKAHNRHVEFTDLQCVLTVEAQGTDPLPPEAERMRFLNSLQRTGPAQW